MSIGGRWFRGKAELNESSWFGSLSAAVLLASCALVGCLGEAAPASYEVRDSAGVRIIEHRPDLDSVVLEIPIDRLWTPDPQVVFSIIDDVLLLPDGMMAVSDNGSQTVRVVELKSGRVSEIGRDGDGPGEFRWVGRLSLIDSSRMAVYDERLDRVTLIDPRTRKILGVVPLEKGVDDLFGLPDESYVGFTNRPTGTNEYQGWARDTAMALRIERDGSVIDTLVEFPGRTVFYVPNSHGNFRTFRRGLYGHEASYTVGEESLYVNGRGDFEIWKVDLRSGLQQVVRVPVDTEVSRAEVDAAWDRVLEEAGERPGTQPYPMPYPEERPAMRFLSVGGDGSLWVSEYGDGELPPRWFYWISPEGTELKRVRFSRRFYPSHVADSIMAGILYDEFDVQTPVAFPFDPSSLSGLR